MALRAHRFVGLDRDVMLPDDIDVRIDIVPDDKIGWVRSGRRFTEQTKTTFHDTGTDGSTAIKQRNYLHNGPMFRDPETKELKRRKVGFNFAVDDTQIIQLTPLNEETWAAGTARGNRESWHVEQCFGETIDFEQSLRNAIALHSGLIAAMGWRADTALVKHQFWTGKWCPGQVLNKGMWPSVQKRIGDQRPDRPREEFENPIPVPELARFRDGDVNTSPALVRSADGTPFFFVGDRVKATRATPRLQRGNPSAPRVGPDLRPGEEFDALWVFVSSADDGAYYLTPFDTRVTVADTERLADRTGSEPGPLISPEVEMDEADALAPDLREAADANRSQDEPDVAVPTVEEDVPEH